MKEESGSEVTLSGSNLHSRDESHPFFFDFFLFDDISLNRTWPNYLGFATLSISFHSQVSSISSRNCKNRHDNFLFI